MVLSQLALADRLVLNKTDLVTEDSIESLTVVLTQHNPSCELLKSERGVVPPREVIGLGGFSLENALKASVRFRDLISPKPAPFGQEWAKSKQRSQDDEHPHVKLGWSNVGFEESSAPLLWDKFADWLQSLVLEHSDRLSRLKGILWVKGAPYGPSTNPNTNLNSNP